MPQVIREIYRLAILSGKPVTRIPEGYAYCALCCTVRTVHELECRSIVRDHARNPSKANKVQRLGVEVSANNAQLGMPAILLGIFGFAVKRNRRSILTPDTRKLTADF